MMKTKIIFLLTAVLIGGVFGSCYDDKSTYPDKEAPSILVDREGTQPFLRVKQGETVRIDPKAELTGGGAGDFTYEWYMKLRNAELKPEEMYFMVSERVGTDAVFEHVVTEPPTPSNQDYVVMLWIKEKNTGQQSTFFWQVAVTTGYGEGLLVAYETGGNAELGFIADPLFARNQTGADRVMLGLVGQNNDIPIQGRLNDVVFTRKGIYAISDDAIFEFDQANYKLKKQNLELFVGREDPVRPTKLIYRPDEQLFMVESSQLYSMPVNDYELRRFTIPYLGNYSATRAVTINSDYPMSGAFYDETREKFMYVPFTWSNETGRIITFPQASVFPAPGRPDPDNIPGMEALCARLTPSKSSYNLLREKATGKLRVYSVNQTGITSVQEIAGPGIERATGFDFHEEYSVMYYYTPENLYSVYLRDEIPTGQLIYSAPAGEEITFFGIFQDVRKILDGRTSGLIDTHNRLLLVGTYGSGQGSVHSIPTRGISGGVDPANSRTFTGFGKITHIVSQE